MTEVQSAELYRSEAAWVNAKPTRLGYCKEKAFRFNTRLDESGKKISDGQRFKMVLTQVIGKYITYDDLTGKERLPVVEAEPL